MKLEVLASEQLTHFLAEINREFEPINFSKVVHGYQMANTNRGDYYLLSNDIADDFFSLKLTERALVHAGIFFGHKGARFALSLEVVDFVYLTLTPSEKERICVKVTAEQAKGVLYGNSVEGVLLDSQITDNWRPEKRYIMVDDVSDPIGIGRLLKDETWRLVPIVDLGQYLRSEDKGMF